MNFSPNIEGINIIKIPITTIHQPARFEGLSVLMRRRMNEILSDARLA